MNQLPTIPADVHQTVPKLEGKSLRTARWTLVKTVPAKNLDMVCDKSLQLNSGTIG